MTADLGSLSFALQSNTGFSQAATVQQGEDSFKADGDGYYDILLTYLSSTKAFTAGEQQTYLITGTGITESSFNALSTSSGGTSGPFLAAIHVQNTPSGGSGSGWVNGIICTDCGTGGGGQDTIPEPASLTLLGVGLAGLGLLRRRRAR